MKRHAQDQPRSQCQSSANRRDSVFRLPFSAHFHLPTALCLLLFVFLSCGHPPRIYMRPQTDLSGFKKIAVLPFDNLSGEEDAGEKITEIFTVELLRMGSFSVAEPGRVKKAVMEKRIRTTRDMDIEAIKWLGESLEVDLILAGSVLDFSVEESANKKVPMVTVISRLVQAESGVTVWTGYQSRQGDDKESLFGWGRITSLSELARLAVSEMLQSLQQ
jgi:TolB-like protein